MDSYPLIPPDKLCENGEMIVPGPIDVHGSVTLMLEMLNQDYLQKLYMQLRVAKRRASVSVIGEGICFGRLISYSDPRI